ncbi:MAG: MFS transporter [Caldisphaera sp.]|jgi:MFS family permease|nr:hypothetical protein [Caldisphaera sp.]PMP60397.1 MAG: hypothetical protein C0201_03035 [Caldisphaera sp.]PMP88240.1 MAG: hypothetical protein C0172_03135 [Caldisphaera sp.]
MWFEIAMLFMGLLSAMDIGIFTYIGYRTSVTPFEYGLIGALWSATFIISNLIFGRLSDKGKNKLLISISFFSILITGLLFTFHSLTSLAIAYMFHALSVASSNLAISTTIFEMKSSNKWKFYTELQRFSLYSIRGLALVSLYFIRNIFQLDYFIYFTVFIGLATFFTIPSLQLKVERSLHSLSKGFDSITSYVKMLSYIAYDNAFALPNAVKRGYFNKKNLSSKNIALSMFFVTLAGDYIFTALPLLAKSTISLGLLWFSYGISGIIMAISLILISLISSNSKGLAILAILFRGLWLVIAISLIKDFVSLIVFITISYMLFSIIDIILYNSFSESSSGYGSHSYYMLRELGTLIGSMIVGLTLERGEIIFDSVPLISTALSIIFIIL